MNDKQKQIEEMAEEIYQNSPCACLDYDETKQVAGWLYKAGYRKQRVCENVSRYRGAFECSVCYWDCDEADNGTTEYRFCPGCGAKLRRTQR